MRSGTPRSASPDTPSASPPLRSHPDRRRGRAEAEVATRLTTWLTHNWPVGPPRPRFFVDARVLNGGVLVTSANFMRRAQDRNIEAGVALSDPEVGQQITGQLREGVSGGAFVELEVGAGARESPRHLHRTAEALNCTSVQPRPSRCVLPT